MVLPLYTQSMEKSPSRWWDLPSAVLLILAILISVWRLTITDWTDNLNYVRNLALVGTVLGLALGASRFGKNGVRWLAIAYTLVLVPRQLIASYESDIYLGEQLAGIFGRLLSSISDFAANKPVQDELFFVTMIATIYWFIGLAAGYHLSRHGNTLAAILPAGIAVLAFQQFDHTFPNRIWLVAAYLFLALTLLGRGQYIRNRAAWVKRGVHLAPETGPDLSMGALIGAGMLILLAWNLPTSVVTPILADKWEEITRPWRATSDRLSRAFASIEGEGDRAEYFRNTLPLGSQATQENSIVFKVYAPPEALELPRLYWRARVYDQYDNGKWTASEQETSSFSPWNENISIPDTELRQEYDFAITAYTHRQAILYLPAQPLWVSRPVDVRSYELPDGQRDVVVLEAFPFLESGETYHARSAIANPSVQDLRAAGQDYPDWLKRYLQLPENFSDRIVGFTMQIAFGLETPYDKAEAITTVLRAQIKYNPSLTLPPEGTDIIEWFLFEGREGYCNYYATAEVLMLRSLGIPARLAVGFAQGDTNKEESEFLVYRKHAHAWPEVYFPGYGWIEFEPTGNQMLLERPIEAGTGRADDSGLETGDNPEVNPARDQPLDNEGGATSTAGSTSNIWQAVLLASGIILLAGAAFFLLNQRLALTTRAAAYILSTAERRGEQGPAWVRNVALYVLAEPFERAFHPVNQSLRWLGASPAPHLTPAERAAILTEILPKATEEIDILSKEYQAEHYSPRAGDLAIARRASLKVWWKGLAAALRRAWE